MRIISPVFLTLILAVTLAAQNSQTPKSPKTAADFYNRGLEKHNAGDLDGAIADYSEALKRDPNDADSWNNRANAKNAKGDRESALPDYARAIELDPANHTYYLNRAGVRRFLDDLDGAMSDFNRVLELFPKYAPGYNNRGVVKRQRGDLDGAFADFNRAIQLVPGFALALFNRGVVYDDRGKLDEALADYDRALQFDPKITGAWNNRGSVRFRRMEFDTALADLNKAVELSQTAAGNSPTAAATRAGAFWNRAWTNLALRNSLQANDDAASFLRLADDKDKKAPYAMMVLYLAQRQMGKAPDAAGAALAVWSAETPPSSDVAIHISNPAKANDKPVAKTDWPKPVMRFLLGGLSNDKLLEVAGTDNDRLTDAHTFIGIELALAGKRDAAIVHLQWVAEKGAKTSQQYTLAAAELRRLK